MYAIAILWITRQFRQSPVPPLLTFEQFESTLDYVGAYQSTSDDGFVYRWIPLDNTVQSMPKRKKNYLTIGDVAKYLQLGERTVHRYVKEGRIKAVKIGGWRIMKKDLQDFIQQSSNTK